MNPYNVTDYALQANKTNEQDTSSDIHLDFVSNGFKLRDSNGALNGSYEYLYIAFAESPFKYSNAR